MLLLLLLLLLMMLLLLLLKVTLSQQEVWRQTEQGDGGMVVVGQGRRGRNGGDRRHVVMKRDGRHMVVGWPGVVLLAPGSRGS